jgi:hypothetical protein
MIRAKEKVGECPSCHRLLPEEYLEDGECIGCQELRYEAEREDGIDHEELERLRQEGMEKIGSGVDDV